VSLLYVEWALKPSQSVATFTGNSSRNRKWDSYCRKWDGYCRKWDGYCKKWDGYCLNSGKDVN